MELKSFLDYVRKYVVPPEAPDCIDDGYGMEYFEARELCTKRGMWAIVDMSWTKRLAKWIGTRKCLEVMSGAGWLAKALSDHGVQIVATDSYAWDGRHEHMKRLFTVKKMTAARAARVHPEAEVLIVSWPPYGNRSIVATSDAWGTERPIVYIGEGPYGCNAPNLFFKHFVEDENAPRIELPRWFGLHDGVQIGRWTRRKP